MQTLKPFDVTAAQGKTKELFNTIERRMGRIPNMIRIMGQSQAVLDAYLHFNEVFAESKTSPKLRSLISALVSEINGCQYTLATALTFGRREGASDEELSAARRAESSDPKTAAALRFVVQTVRGHGAVPVSDVGELRAAGYSDEEIVELIGLTSLNILRNYFNLIAGTEVDFPTQN